MKKLIIKRVLIYFIVALMLLAFTSAGFANVVRPGGPSTEGRTMNEGIVQYEDHIRTLERIERTSRGNVEVFTLDKYGKSDEGRSIYCAKVGDGDTVFFAIARIHGGEQTPTKATLDLLHSLGSSGNRMYDKIRNEMTLYVIPIANPDGSELNIRGTPIEWEGETVNLDMNRDWTTFCYDTHDWQLGTPLQQSWVGFNSASSQALYKFWCDIKPDYFLDIHTIGTGRVVPDGDWYSSFQIGISLAPGGPTLPHTPYEDIARQMAVSAYRGLTDNRGGNVAVDRYYVGWTPDIVGFLDYWGGVSSAVMVGVNWEGYNDAGHSCPAIFFETRGNTYDGSFGQRAQGYLSKQNYYAMRGLLHDIATGDIYNIDPEGWDNEIPHFPNAFYMTDHAFMSPLDFERPCADWEHSVWDCPCPCP